MHLSICRGLILVAFFLFGLLPSLDGIGRTRLGLSTTSLEQTSEATLSKNIPVQRDSVANTRDLNLTPYYYVLGVICLGVFIAFSYGSTGRKKTKKFPWVEFGLARVRDERELKLKRQLTLTAKHSLHLVVWNDQEFLLACGDHGVTLISHREGGDLTAEKEVLATLDIAKKDEDQTS